MIPHDVAREAALILANNPDRQTLAVAAGRLHRLHDGIRHVDGRWHLSPAARRAVGSVPPDLARQRLEHARQVVCLALTWLDEPPSARAA
jgi:hypothetical protein